MAFSCNPRRALRGAMKLTERRRGRARRADGQEGASLLRSPLPDLGMGQSSEDEADAWAADDDEVRLRSEEPHAATANRVPSAAPASRVRRVR